jgi:hypothetical protein
MLSSMRIFPAQKPCCPPKSLCRTSIPPSNSKHPKSRPLFVHVVRCSVVISLAEILRGGDVNRDFRRRPTEEIGSDFFFVFFREIILQPFSVNQRDNRLYVGIELYNAISRHSPLTCHCGSGSKDENTTRLDSLSLWMLHRFPVLCGRQTSREKADT